MARTQELPLKRGSRKRAVTEADPLISRLLSLVDNRRAAEICDKVLEKRIVADRDCATAKLLGLRPDEVIFWPEDFVIFFTLAAAEAGIDVQAYGARLDPKALKLLYVPGGAFRTVAQVVGVYAENPGALTLFKSSTRVPGGDDGRTDRYRDRQSRR